MNPPSRNNNKFNKPHSQGGGNKQNSNRNSGKFNNSQRNKNKNFSKNRNNQNRKEELRRANRVYPEGAVPEIIKPVIANEELESSNSTKEVPSVLTQLYDEDKQELISFDEALEKILEKETLEPGESIMYAGAGSFAVVSSEREGRKIKQVVKRKIVFEKHRENEDWKNSLRYGLSLSYTPNPQPLSELYTDDEIANFELNRHK